MTRRGVFAALAWCSAAFAAYGSLVPLRWREDPQQADIVGLVLKTPLEPLAAPGADFFVNLLVLFPVGLFTSAALHRTSRSRLVTLAAALLVSVSLAFTIELSQTLVRDRTPSWSDVAGLTLGGLTGALVWRAVGPSSTERLIAFLGTASAERLVGAAVVTYAAGWAVVGLLPLAFPRFAYPLVRTVWLRPAPPAYATTVLAAFLIDALAVVPIGGALVMGARAFVSRTLAAVAFVAAGAAAVILIDGFRQITPFTVLPAPGARLAGLAAGACLVILAWRMPLTFSRRVVAGLLAVWCAVLVLVAWAPFDFGVPPELLEARTRLLYERAPLHRYYWAPPLVALEMVLSMILLALPVGALLTLATGRSGTASLGLVTLSAVSIFIALEWGQLYLPGRRADVTDVLLASGGAFIGALFARRVAESRRRPRADS